MAGLIKQLQNVLKTTNIFPVTLFNAVYDDDGNTLDSRLGDCISSGDTIGTTDTTVRDADTLGGLYTADDITTINETLTNLILDKLYPIGSIYLETTNTNPSSKLGGTWVAYGSSDTYLRLGGNGSGGANSVTLKANQIPTLTTGGVSNDHTHSGTTDSAGAHSHGVSYNMGSSVAFNGDGVCGSQPNTKSTFNAIETLEAGSHAHTFKTGGMSGDHSHTYTNNNQQSVDITPKYVGVYAWKRTA